MTFKTDLRLASTSTDATSTKQQANMKNFIFSFFTQVVLQIYENWLETNIIIMAIRLAFIESM